MSSSLTGGGSAAVMARYGGAGGADYSHPLAAPRAVPWGAAPRPSDDMARRGDRFPPADDDGDGDLERAIAASLAVPSLAARPAAPRAAASGERAAAAASEHGDDDESLRLALEASLASAAAESALDADDDAVAGESWGGAMDLTGCVLVLLPPPPCQLVCS